jgi:hypothetical protein
MVTGTALLFIKQRLNELSERERREVSAFLSRLGRETPAWKKETARRLNDMVAGKQTSVADLRRRICDGN